MFSETMKPSCLRDPQRKRRKGNTEYWKSIKPAYIYKDDLRSIFPLVWEETFS